MRWWAESTEAAAGSLPEVAGGPGEADEGASQTVAGKSNVAAELIYDGSSIEIEATGFIKAAVVP